jgi:preprotein translocase subunit YajC
MDFLIQTAQAENGAAGGNPLVGLLLPILILVVFYFLFLRPQQKRMKEHRQMVSELKEGDEVLTNGGIAGRVTDVQDSFVRLRVADNVELQVQKHSVASLLPKGTLQD